MPTFLEILNEKVRRLETIPDALLSASQSFQVEAFKIVESLIRDLSTTGGNIDMTASNLTKIERIDSLLKKAMGEGEYLQAAIAFKDEMAKQAAITLDYFKALTGDEVATEFGAALVRTRQADAVELILGSSMEVGFVRPLKDQLLAAVANNAGITDTHEALQTFVLGNAEVDGRLLAYTRTYASDVFATTDRAYTATISDDLELEWYLFTGGLINTTRCFCKNRNAKYYHRAEIQSWGRGENLGVCNTGKGWAGMAKGTNEATIFSYLGGYNCQHGLGPVSVSVVPKADIERAIKVGFYEPSQVERELLGL